MPVSQPSNLNTTSSAKPSLATSFTPQASKSRCVAMSPSRGKPLQLQPVPPVLRPLVRAYLLGYASAVAPRLLTLVLQQVLKRRRLYKKKYQTTSDKEDRRSFAESAVHILRTGLELHRFPAFCAALVGGTSLLQVCCSHCTSSAPQRNTNDLTFPLPQRTDTLN